MYAAGKGHQEIVKLLLKFKAKTDAKDYNGKQLKFDLT